MLDPLLPWLYLQMHKHMLIWFYWCSSCCVSETEYSPDTLTKRQQKWWQTHRWKETQFGNLTGPLAGIQCLYGLTLTLFIQESICLSLRTELEGPESGPSLMNSKTEISSVVCRAQAEEWVTGLLLSLSLLVSDWLKHAQIPLTWLDTYRILAM